jgi:outer membrane protein OmpA-like peptidoglycan-associated protein/tetratricopeptide (TPR) repeat protein
MRVLTFLLLLTFFIQPGFTQKKTGINDIRNVYDEKGDYYFDQKQYKKAIVYYNMAFKKDQNNYYSVLRKAEAFSALELYDQAAESYGIIFETNLYIPNEFRYKYALLLLNNKNIKGFEEWLGKYNQIVNEEISGYVSATEARAKMYKDSTIVIVENESVLNTNESEISPVIINDDVVFSSTRTNLAATSGNAYYNLFSATYLDDGRLGRLNRFNASVNSSESESATTFSNTQGLVYITRGAASKNNLKTLKAYPVSNNEKMDLSEFSIPGFGKIAHPTFNSKGSIMYFVSDAPGGIGGYDLYFSEYSNGKWNQPKSLGNVVNSAQNELYPHLVNDSVLYFTSARDGGFGGLDLYYVKLNKKNPVAVNMGSKVNSEYDDFSLSFSQDGITGYFSSNRPGGFGKEDIYRLHYIGLKVKYAAYRFKRKSFMESDKINLYMTDGEEYNIASEDKTGFNFGFQPEEGYKMIIQHENAVASNIIYDTKLSAEERKQMFLQPSPIQKTEIKLQPGTRYQFTAGMKPLSNEYKTALKDMSGEYQNTGSAIDLTALAKELFLKEGEVYTIRFVKDDSQTIPGKSKNETSLFVNNTTVPATGKSFFIVLPLDIQANFNIKTDIDHFKEAYNPKKVGSVKVDDAPVYKEVQVKESEGFPILVNTESMTEVSKRKVKAKELTIVPGTMYILSLSKKLENTDQEIEIVVPLTKGVKYNLGTEGQSGAAYNKAISQMSAQQKSGATEGELIDISVLSKELDITSERNIVFTLMPAKQFAGQTSSTRNVLTTLNVDGRKFFVTDRHRLQVNLKLDQTKKVNIQTDLEFVKENFDASTIAMKVDNKSFTEEIKEKEKDIITDPVFDVIVVNFDLNDFTVRPDAKVILQDKVISVLNGDSRLYVTIKGYTDGLGDAAHNKKLSGQRAQAVREFLSNNGIGEKRIRTFSYGESMSLKEGQLWEDLSEEELEKHRKVEIVIYIPKK